VEVLDPLALHEEFAGMFRKLVQRYQDAWRVAAEREGAT